MEQMMECLWIEMKTILKAGHEETMAKMNVHHENNGHNKSQPRRDDGLSREAGGNFRRNRVQIEASGSP
jgi:hypothetical protein